MLPFLKKNKVAGLIISKRAKDGSISDIEDRTEGEDQGLMACAQDLIDSMHAKDASRVVSAMRAMRHCLDAETEDESNDYDSQNQKAAEDVEE